MERQEKTINKNVAFMNAQGSPYTINIAIKDLEKKCTKTANDPAQTIRIFANAVQEMSPPRMICLPASSKTLDLQLVLIFDTNFLIS